MFGSIIDFFSNAFDLFLGAAIIMIIVDAFTGHKDKGEYRKAGKAYLKYVLGMIVFVLLLKLLVN